MDIVELVANVSESRSRERLSRLIESVDPSGARLVDVHSDDGHNRSVLTILGAATQVSNAAVDLARACRDELDIRGHRGVHPRFGALDVCPFVPIGPMDDPSAIRETVRSAASRIAELGIPVFLYDAAAYSSRSLPEIRRESFDRIQPDFGPRTPHPTAGACAVGARGVLVAYNIEIGTSDLAAAQQTAAAVRESNGGPAGLRSLALWLPESKRMQISMNLTRPYETGIGAAWDAVEAAATAHGISLLGGELVGLAPRCAIGDARPEILERSGIDDTRTIEFVLGRENAGPDGPA